MADDKNGDEDKVLEELKNLPPEERIKKLKEFEEKKKKEIEKAEKLLEDSLDEIKQTADKKQEEEGLAEEEQEREGKGSEDDNLEETVKKSKPKIPKELLEQQIQYTDSIKQLTSHDMYDNLQRWVGQAEQGTLSSEYEDVITELYQQVNDEYLIMKKVQEEATKRYDSSEDMLDKLVAARKVLKDIGYKTNWFRRG